MALLLILTPLATGCDSILATENRFADRVQIEITGTSEGPLTLVTSTNFFVGTDLNSGAEVVVVNDSTISPLTLPFNQQYPFTSSYRFLVRVVNPDASKEATVRLRVLLDGMLVNDQSATLTDQPIQFTWRYL